MDRSLYRYILKLSAVQQCLLLLLVLLSMPVVYITLELPKLIINQAIGGEDVPEVLFSFPMNQIDYLVVLCLAFLLAVIVAGLLKYAINVVQGVIGEQILRKLRTFTY